MVVKKTGAGGRAEPGGGAPSGGKADAPLYSFRIELRGVKPKIWRRFFCPSDVTLEDLHEVIQKVMGWYGGHLHFFIVDGVDFHDDPEATADEADLPFRIPRGERWDWLVDRTTTAVTLDRLGLRVNEHFRYVYDFGDDWDHDLRVMSLDFKPKEPGRRYGCLAGARACPPEDCGGVWGYCRILRLLGKPVEPEPRFQWDEEEDEEEKEWLLEWHGDYDPDYFSVERVNSKLP